MFRHCDIEGLFNFEEFSKEKLVGKIVKICQVHIYHAEIELIFILEFCIEYKNYATMYS
jgi:hypothetical protein